MDVTNDNQQADRIFTLDDMRECFLRGFVSHAESYRMNVYDAEFLRAKSMFNDWLQETVTT